MAEDEKILVERAREGDPSAFEELVGLFQGRVRAFFAARLWDAVLVDDLAQDAFFIAYRRLDTFDPSRPFYPWLKGIAANVLNNEMRKCRPSLFEDPACLEAGLERAAAEEAERVLERTSERETFGALRHCLERLKGMAARVIEARYRLGLSLKDLAEKEGKSPKALSVALVRIRRSLRKCLEDRLGAEGAAS